MSFLLDTNICSYHLRAGGMLTHRFVQHSGRLYLSTIVLGELYTWAYQRPDPMKTLRLIENDLLPDMQVLLFDEPCAETFGQVRARLLKTGITVSATDMQIAAVALTHDLTLVTHNVRDFRAIPDLRIEDWLQP